MAFWGMLPAANVHPPMVVGILLRMFILSFHHDSTLLCVVHLHVDIVLT